MGGAEVEAFLSWLAVTPNVAASTHKQALSALLFFFGKDRAVMLPQRLIAGLKEQLARARVLWNADQDAGRGGVEMPDALNRKYPKAGASWNWFWAFPQDAHSVDPRTGA